MRLQVLLHSFGGVFLLIIALFIWLTYGMTQYEAFLNITFVASISFLRLLSDDKHVLTFEIREGRISITYLSQFLQVKSIDFALSDITEARLSKQLIIYAVWSPVLNLKVEGERIRFFVVTKKLYNEIQRHLTSGIDFKKLNATVLDHSKELTEDELSLYHKVLLSMEHFASIFAHNDKFGNLKTIERGYENGIWKGFKMKGDILETQNDFLEDMKYIRSQEKHLNEFFSSELLIDIMDKFFETKTSHNIGIANSGAGH